MTCRVLSFQIFTIVHPVPLLQPCAYSYEMPLPRKGDGHTLSQHFTPRACALQPYPSSSHISLSPYLLISCPPLTLPLAIVTPSQSQPSGLVIRSCYNTAGLARTRNSCRGNRSGEVLIYGGKQARGAGRRWSRAARQGRTAHRYRLDVDCLAGLRL